MCLEVVACASQVSKDGVLWVGCSIVLLNEGVCRAIALNFWLPLWTSLLNLLGGAWWSGALASYRITRLFICRVSVFPSETDQWVSSFSAHCKDQIGSVIW